MQLQKLASMANYTLCTLVSPSTAESKLHFFETLRAPVCTPSTPAGLAMHYTCTRRQTELPRTCGINLGVTVEHWRRSGRKCFSAASLSFPYCSTCNVWDRLCFTFRCQTFVGLHLEQPVSFPLSRRCT